MKMHNYKKIQSRTFGFFLMFSHNHAFGYFNSKKDINCSLNLKNVYSYFGFTKIHQKKVFNLNKYENVVGSNFAPIEGCSNTVKLCSKSVTASCRIVVNGLNKQGRGKEY